MEAISNRECSEQCSKWIIHFVEVTSWDLLPLPGSIGTVGFTGARAWASSKNKYTAGGAKSNLSKTQKVFRGCSISLDLGLANITYPIREHVRLPYRWEMAPGPTWTEKNMFSIVPQSCTKPCLRLRRKRGPSGLKWALQARRVRSGPKLF